MKITQKEVDNINKIIDGIIEGYKENTQEKKRDWRTYEQQLTERIRFAIRELEPLIKEAVASLTIVNEETRGRDSNLNLKQKTTLLLLQRLIGKSNRKMSCMLVMFSLLSDIDVSYKTIERLYSDEAVLMVLHNMHMLMLKKKGVTKPNCSGDGTGYSLSIKKHYATEVQKLKDKVKNISKKHKKRQFVYSFKLIDLDTNMYVGSGISFKSEKEAYYRALHMVEELGSIRLDKYYSGQRNVKFLKEKFDDLVIYLIPKKNATIRGSYAWKRMLHKFVNNTQKYLKEYFKRNRSESGFSEDKREFGWKIAQIREDRINTADFCIVIWHNLFWLKS